MQACHLAIPFWEKKRKHDRFSAVYHRKMQDGRGQLAGKKNVCIVNSFSSTPGIDSAGRHIFLRHYFEKLSDERHMLERSYGNLSSG